MKNLRPRRLVRLYRGPLNADVMRHASLALLILVSGCASTPCDCNLTAPWIHVDSPPPEAASLYALAKRENALARRSLTSRDYWFASGTDQLLLCRSWRPYGCAVHYYKFQRVNGTWVIPELGVAEPVGIVCT